MSFVGFREPRVKDEPYLRMMRLQQCIVCGDNTSVEAAHIRYAERSVCKRQVGKSEKPHDHFTVPLCSECHREQHSMNERKWWAIKGIDPVKFALAIYYWWTRGDTDAIAVVVANARPLSGDMVS
jgi:hypothetical protein